MSVMDAIDSVRIKGFRSLADVEIRGLPDLAVMIGANGSGKSNIIRFFEMMSWMLRAGQLNEFVQRQGGADDQLFGGRGKTPVMEAEVSMRTEAGRNDYRFALAHAHPDRFIFTDEAFRFRRVVWDKRAKWQHLDSGHTEANIVAAGQSPDFDGVNLTAARGIANLLRGCSAYQFHDTSDNSKFKERWDAGDNAYLRSHGGNLGAMLLRLEREEAKRFDLLRRQIERVVPMFDRFELAESYGRVMLRWRAKGMDKTIGAHLTSDGSLRFFALATLLSLPSEMLPNVLLLDEPELGLHPSAVSLIGGMIRSLSVSKQVIVATQSPLLVDSFDVDQIIVLDLEKDGRTKARRLDPGEYERWLEEYSTGMLWQKNLFGGRP